MTQNAAKTDPQAPALSQFFDSMGRFISIDPTQQFGVKQKTGAEWSSISAYSFAHINGFPGVVLQKSYNEIGNSIRLASGEIFTDSPFSVFTETSFANYIDSLQEQGYACTKELKILDKLQAWKEQISPEQAAAAMAEADTALAPMRERAKQRAQQLKQQQEEAARPYTIVKAGDDRVLVAFNMGQPQAIKTQEADGSIGEHLANGLAFNQSALREQIIQLANQGLDTSIQQRALKELEKATEDLGLTEIMNDRVIFGFLVGPAAQGRIIVQRDEPLSEAMARLSETYQQAAGPAAGEEEPEKRWENEGGTPDPDKPAASTPQP